MVDEVKAKKQEKKVKYKKIKKIPVARKYSEKDYKVVDKWVQKNVDLKKARDTKEGREIILKKLRPQDKGLKKLTEKGRFDKFIFEAFAIEVMQEKVPERVVKDVERWRERKVGRLVRGKATARLTAELRAFETISARDTVEANVAVHFNLSPITILEDITTLITVGWVRAAEKKKEYIATAEGRRVMKTWME